MDLSVKFSVTILMNELLNLENNFIYLIKRFSLWIPQGRAILLPLNPTCHEEGQGNFMI